MTTEDFITNLFTVSMKPLPRFPSVCGRAVFDIYPNYPYISGAVILFSGFILCALWLRRGSQTATQPAATSAPLESAPASRPTVR